MVDCFYGQTNEEIQAASPNRADGISVEKEKRLLRCCHRLIDAVVTRKYEFPSYLTATAHYLVTRFYSQRSYVHNDFFCISSAALSLAGKFENRPRSLDYIIETMFEVRYAKNPEKLRDFANYAEFRCQVKESVLHGEELLLEVVGKQIITFRHTMPSSHLTHLFVQVTVFISISLTVTSSNSYPSWITARATSRCSSSCVVSGRWSTTVAGQVYGCSSLHENSLLLCFSSLHSTVSYRSLFRSSGRTVMLMRVPPPITDLI